MWNTVEKSCKDLGLRVSISSEQPGKIQFSGNRNAITKAREMLGELAEVSERSKFLIYIMKHTRAS